MAKGALYWRHKKEGKWTYTKVYSYDWKQGEGIICFDQEGEIIE